MRGSIWRGLTPPQSHQSELLDGTVDPALLADNLRDMARANRWLGANHAVLRRIETWLSRTAAADPIRVLDLATGSGDLAGAIGRWSVRRGFTIEMIASDLSDDVLRVAQVALRNTPAHLVRHDALALPFADQSVAIVTCSQALHHFSPDAVAQLLRECARVARLGVIVSDLRRSYAAYWGARLLAIGHRSPLSRHDGPLSVLRAYTPAEIRRIVRDAELDARVRRARAFRVEVEIIKEG